MADTAKQHISRQTHTRDSRDPLRLLAQLDKHNLPLLQWDSELEKEDGTGVRLALLDSGIAWRHPVFAGANIDGCDFTGSGSMADGTGHGTCIAALLVGQDPHYLRGIAPRSELLVARVLDCNGRARGDEVIARAVEWAITQHADFIIIPLGRRPGSRRIAQAVRRAVQAGTRLIAAAGNRGPDVLAFPASLNGVTAVSAVDGRGQPLDWCCQSQKVSCYAPGESIWSLKDTPMNGSSPATIMAAGVAALQLARQSRLQQNHNSNEE